MQRVTPEAFRECQALLMQADIPTVVRDAASYCVQRYRSNCGVPLDVVAVLLDFHGEQIKQDRYGK